MANMMSDNVTERRTFASLPRTERGKPMILGIDPKEKNFLYCVEKSIIIRDIENPNDVDIYTEHSKNTTVAKYNSDGNYIASGDTGGTIRVWDTCDKEHRLKSELRPFGGKVKDISWGDESTRQKLLVGGGSGGNFLKCITFDSGNNIGKMEGHTKEVNAVAFRPCRPFRAVSASEDFSMLFFDDPSFKHQIPLRDHQNFVNIVRYSPDGKIFVSGGADGKAFVYDGLTGEKMGYLGEPKDDQRAHGGGIYGLEFSPKADSHELLTVSADKTAKIWNTETRQLVQEFVLGTTQDDMQVGCLWEGKHILTVSLSGHINYLDRSTGKPGRIIKGNNKAITCMATDDRGSLLFTGQSDSQIHVWNPETGDCEKMKGESHSKNCQIQKMVVFQDQLITVAFDDMIVYSNIHTHECGHRVKLPSQPRGLAVNQRGLVVVACINEIVVVEEGKIVNVKAVKFSPSCVDIQAVGPLVAVGGKEHNMKKVFIYNLEGNELIEGNRFQMSKDVDEEPFCLKFSPCGNYLACGGAKRAVSLFSTADFSNLYTAHDHNAKVNTICWNPDSKHFATGSLDQSIVIWCLDTGAFKQKCGFIKSAHKLSWSNDVVWLSDSVLASCGQDACVKQYNVTF